MLACLAIAIALAAAALCRVQHRRAVAWRAGLMSDCAGHLTAARVGRDRAGFATLRGGFEGAAVGACLVPDTLVHRRLPQLWLHLTVRMPLATTAILDVLRRPVGAEFYAPDGLPVRCAVPGNCPPDTLVRGTAGAEELLSRVAPSLGPILADSRVKEILMTPGGLRLTVQASEGTRGAYLLLRGSRFPLERVPADMFESTLRAGLHLARILSDTSSEVPHVRAA